jgi:hypothetical protein
MTPAVRRAIETMLYAADELADSSLDTLAQALRYAANQLHDENRTPPAELVELRARLSQVRNLVR